MKYTVWIVTLPNYPHTQAFDWLAESLNATLIEMGHDSRIVRDGHKCRGRVITLAGHLLKPLDYLPDDMIIYNLEQMSSGWISEHYLGLMRRCEVWDYSQRNMVELLKFGIVAKHCAVGYSDGIAKIPDHETDISILFYGSVNQRRREILELLGDKVHVACGIYGTELDTLISRSKVVLNIHYYPDKIFEITRCGYLFANRKCVVSELGPEDGAYRHTGGFCDPEMIGQYCDAFLRNEELRKRVADQGFEIFTGQRQRSFLEAVL